MAEKMILTYRGRPIKLKPLSKIKEDKRQAHIQWVFDQLINIEVNPEYRDYFRKYLFENLNG